MEVKVIKESFEKRIVRATNEVAMINEFLTRRLECDSFKSEDELNVAKKLKEQVAKLVDDMITASLTANELMAKIRANNIKKIGSRNH